jgi:hypothetical protein
MEEASLSFVICIRSGAMTEASMISPLTTVVTFAFAGLVIGGVVVYLALISRKGKK